MTIYNRDFSQSKLMPIAWSIAGSDNSGGAGIQADNKSFASFGVYGCNIVTAVTSQNRESVSNVLPVPAAHIKSQWQALQEQYPPDVIKLGMLTNSEVVQAVVEQLQGLDVPVVCDPVLIASNGGSLMESSQSYHQLMPQIDLLTPNEEEFSTLFDLEINNPQQLIDAARQIAEQYRIDLVVTGGESLLDKSLASDCCVIDGDLFWMHSPRQQSEHTHGSGCSFASALAAALALGYSRYEACVLAKAYMNQGLELPDFFSEGPGAFQHTRFPDRLHNLPAISHDYHVRPFRFPSCDTLNLGLYPVVDSVEWLECCLQEGVHTLQLRLKDMPEPELDVMIARAVSLGRKYQARLFINDYWQLAIKHQAYGVHLGQEDLQQADLAVLEKAGLHLGISTHSWFEIAVAHSYSPSYIAIGPVFATTTKDMPYAPQGLQQLQQWVQLLADHYPLVAIGGINAGNAARVLETGVGSIALVRAITEAEDYRSAIANLLRLCKRG